MYLSVNSEILRHYPSMHLGVIIAKDIDNDKRVSVVSSLLRGVHAEKIREFKGKKIEEDPRIKVWRKAFKSFDANPEHYKSSLEYLLKKAVKGQQTQSVNPIVDICNYISLKYCVPMHCHDADQLSGDLQLSYASGEEPFKEIDTEVVEHASPREVIYHDEGGIICRAWNYKHADRTKCTNKTKNALILIDDMGVLGEKKLKEAMKDFAHLLSEYCGTHDIETHILNHDETIDVGVEGLYGVSDDGRGEVSIFQRTSISAKKIVAKAPSVAADLTPYSKLVQNLLKKAIKKATSKDISDIKIDYPKDLQHGNYASSVALKLAKEEGENPVDLAKRIIDNLEAKKWLKKVECAGPGFINFHISHEALIGLLENVELQKDKFGNSSNKVQKKMLVEFAHPNTHKAFHIGHLRNISLGESIVRILESQGIQVFRANYQGDIGPHVAKCLWGYMRTEVPELKTVKAKAEFLGKVYAIGAKAYESDPQAKEEITLINKQIYQKDPEITPLWQETRRWSLDYFEEIYKLLGSHFDRLFFESEVFQLGHDLVMEGFNNGIFEKSEGAIVYNGEKHGLHKRVFITSQETTTYEGKEVGLAKLEKESFDFDKKIHVVANEQEGYFEVVFHAIEDLMPELKGKQKHISYGMVRLDSGKMSSRTGDVITAEYLLEEARQRVNAYVEKTSLSNEDKQSVTEIVSVGAIKFMMLHSTASSDIVFDIDKATRLEGASGPYLQYAHARIQSIINKVVASSNINYELFNDEDWQLAQKLLYFTEIVTKAAEDFSSHHISHYLLELASQFSSWYDKNHVLTAEEGLRNARLKLLSGVEQVIKNGLYLLGIKAPDQM